MSDHIFNVNNTLFNVCVLAHVAQEGLARDDCYGEQSHVHPHLRWGGHCSTGQSPQWAVVPLEEEEDINEDSMRYADSMYVGKENSYKVLG